MITYECQVRCYPSQVGLTSAQDTFFFHLPGLRNKNMEIQFLLTRGILVPPQPQETQYIWTYIIHETICMYSIYIYSMYMRYILLYIQEILGTEWSLLYVNGSDFFYV